MPPCRFISSAGVCVDDFQLLYLSLYLSHQNKLMSHQGGVWWILISAVENKRAHQEPPIIPGCLIGQIRGRVIYDHMNGDVWFQRNYIWSVCCSRYPTAACLFSHLLVWLEIPAAQGLLDLVLQSDR
jgi:hypothetical protein